MYVYLIQVDEMLEKHFLLAKVSYSEPWIYQKIFLFFWSPFLSPKCKLVNDLNEHSATDVHSSFLLKYKRILNILNDDKLIFKIKQK